MRTSWILRAFLLLSCLNLPLKVAHGADAEPVSQSVPDGPKPHASTEVPAPETDKEPSPGASGGAGSESDLTVKFSWSNGLVGETDDKAFRVHFGGRFDFDSGWYRVPANGQSSLNTPLLEGTDLRRFRLGADGTIWDQVEFALEADLSRGEDFKQFESTPQTNIFITDAWLALHDLPVVDTVRLGHQKEYLTFYNATSSKFYPFLERPYLFDAYEDDFSYDSGISTNRTYCDQCITTWLGAFWNGTRSQAFNVGGQYAVSGRATWMPIYDESEQRWVCLEVSGTVRSEASNPVAVTVRPLVRTGQNIQVPDLIDTGTIFGLDGLQSVGTGLHGAWGRWTFGTQYLCRIINNAFIGGLPNSNGTLPPGVVPVGNLYFWGYSAELLYFLTPGDHQPVDRIIPGYARVRPVRPYFCSTKSQRGPGAWELGLRYDYVNVNSGSIPAGQLSSITAGLNWYLNANARIMANYVWTNRDVGPAPGTGNFSAFGLRVHFDF